MDRFNDGEQKILDLYPKAIDEVKSMLTVKSAEKVEGTNDNGGDSLGMARVKTLETPGVSFERKEEPVVNSRETVNYYGGGINDYPGIDNKQQASSFVIILAAVISMVVIAFLLGIYIIPMFK